MKHFSQDCPSWFIYTVVFNKVRLQKNLNYEMSVNWYEVTLKLFVLYYYNTIPKHELIWIFIDSVSLITLEWYVLMDSNSVLCWTVLRWILLSSFYI